MLFIGIFSSFAQTGAALNFDSYNDVVDCGNMTQVNGVSALTLETWLYIPGSYKPNYAGIFSKTTGGGDLNIHLAMQDGTNALFFNISDNGNFESYGITGNNPVPINTWTHVAAVFDGTGVGNANRCKYILTELLNH